MKHLLWVVGLVALGPATYFFKKFYESPADQNTHYGVYSAVFSVIALVLFGMFVFRRFREEGQQDISITKL